MAITREEVAENRESKIQHLRERGGVTLGNEGMFRFLLDGQGKIDDREILVPVGRNGRLAFGYDGSDDDGWYQRLGKKSVIGPEVYIGQNGYVGEEAIICFGSTIHGKIGDRALVGERAHIIKNAVIGADSTIGHFSTIENATFSGETGDHVQIYNGSVVENSKIGKDTAINSTQMKNAVVGTETIIHQSSFGDQAQIGDNAVIRKSNFGDHTRIGDDVTISQINFEDVDNVEASISPDQLYRGDYIITITDSHVMLAHYDAKRRPLVLPMEQFINGEASDIASAVDRFMTGVRLKRGEQDQMKSFLAGKFNDIQEKAVSHLRKANGAREKMGWDIIDIPEELAPDTDRPGE